jgi:hypothetical protein
MKDYTVTVNASVTVVGIEADNFDEAKERIHELIKDNQITLESCYIDIHEWVHNPIAQERIGQWN